MQPLTQGPYGRDSHRIERILVLDLHTLLCLENRGSDRLQGYCRAGSPGRIFGGHLAAQGLTSVGRMVPTTAAVDSLHGYVVSSGDPQLSIAYQVSRLRDGRTYSSHQVTGQ